MGKPLTEEQGELEANAFLESLREGVGITSAERITPDDVKTDPQEKT